MNAQSLYHTLQRYRTLRTHVIRALPILILMPHSACNCRCVMCDIWKSNKSIRQLTEEDLRPLLSALKNLGTKQVLMSGGEALLHPGFFRLCQLLRENGLHLTLHSSGLLLEKHADDLVAFVDDLILSLDGDGPTHDAIRNIAGAYTKLKAGVQSLKARAPTYRITARTVIHRLNFRALPDIIRCARATGLDQVSFLPADVSSQAFNRETRWNAERQEEVALHRKELPQLKQVLENVITTCAEDFTTHFIAESPQKLMNIYTYYCAVHGLCAFPFKQCNAPWVSAVIEPDGSVRPCFFHDAVGNVRTQPLAAILNAAKALRFRKELDMETNEICRRCVCSLNLPPGMNPLHKT